MTLGEIVRSYRDSHSMTMAEFAERAGLSKGYISMLEKNRNPRTGAPIIPSITTYEGVSKATGLSVQELMESTRGEDISLSVPSAPPAAQKSDGLPERDRTQNGGPAHATAREMRQLEKVLTEPGLTYNGVVLTDDDRQKINKALELAFWDAKEKNKRK